MAHETKNTVIKSQVIAFFAEREKKGLEDEAVYLIENREDVDSANVMSAIEYLGKIKYTTAQPSLRALLDDGEDRWTAVTVKAIGSASDESNAAEVAQYLVGYYETKNPPEQIQHELIAALGETHSGGAAVFLADLINNTERPALAVAAISNAVEALGAFQGEDVDKALLDAFRDSYYKTRLAAIKASGARKFTDAVPYLKFRAEKDEVPAVREEAVRSLGAIGSPEAADILNTLFEDKKIPDRLRGAIAQMLVKINADTYAEKLVIKLQEAKRLNQKQLYNSLITALSKAKTAKLKEFTGTLFASKEAVDKALALELTGLNGFSEFTGDVQRLAGEGGSGLALKAKEILNKLGGAAPPDRYRPIQN